LIERASLAETGVDIGDDLVVETPDGARHTVRISGTAYDPGKISPVLEGDQLSGYIGLDTLVALGQPASYNELHIVAAVDPRDLRQGEAVAATARDEVLEPEGIAVHRTAVHDTSRYHGAALTDVIILVLTVLGGLILLLGVFLVINTVNAIMSQQVRQIGVMKAVGGQRRQIAGIYLGLVLAYGVLALVIAMPLAALGAWALSSAVGGMLNLEIDGPWFPPQVVGIELALALLVPMLAALVPVLNGTRLTVREAITSYGIGERGQAGGMVATIAKRLRSLPRTVLLALGNTFRRKGRLALTLTTLTIGGALFASIAIVQSSLDATMVDVMRYNDYDVELSLQDMVPADEAIREVMTVPGVEDAEGWIATNPSRIRPDGTQNSNIWLVAPPADSQLVKPTLVDGRWLEPGEGAALVVNVDFRDAEPDVDVGDEVTLNLEGVEVTWPVIGVVSSQLTGPVVYAPVEPLSEAIGVPGETNRVVLLAAGDSADAHTEVATEAERTLRDAGVPVAQVQTSDDIQGGPQSVFDLVVMMLLVVAVLLVLVGGIGLAGAMSLSVIERRQEIGVMRAIGASNRTLARIVIVEGMTVGLLSWVLGALLALPLSWGLSRVIGVAFLQWPLSYAFSATGLLLWLAIVVVVSVLASVLPARGAWRLSVREVLAYE
jgi:putative ABC transport system permease protein